MFKVVSHDLNDANETIRDMALKAVSELLEDKLLFR